jgi:hypothetical protein
VQVDQLQRMRIATVDQIMRTTIKSENTYLTNYPF